MGLHAGIFSLVILVPLFWHFPTSTQAKSKMDVTPIDLSPYVTKLPAGAAKAGGCGGANDHPMTPVNNGNMPKLKRTSFTPQQRNIQDLYPKLAMNTPLTSPPD